LILLIDRRHCLARRFDNVPVRRPERDAPGAEGFRPLLEARTNHGEGQIRREMKPAPALNHARQKGSQDQCATCEILEMMTNRWTSFEGARKTVPLEEFDEGVPTLLRVFGASVDVDAPPTPFALGPEVDGADFDLRARGLSETDSEVLQARPGLGEGQRPLGLTPWG
jgi:hypothetical protein